MTKFTKYDEEATSQEPVVTEQNIGSAVLEVLKRHSLDPENCVGISTDGCSIMISAVKREILGIKKKNAQMLQDAHDRVVMSILHLAAWGLLSLTFP